jgi:hypothetical protein
MTYDDSNNRGRRQYPSRDNSGALFTNSRKAGDGDPDFTGRVDVGGVEYWISAWGKTSKGGSAPARPFKYGARF